MQECLKQLYHLKKTQKVKLHITKNYSESVLKITKYLKKVSSLEHIYKL